MKETRVLRKLAVLVFIIHLGNYVQAQHSEWQLKRGVLFFAPNSDSLNGSVKRELMRLKEEMQANPSFKVVIEGSACHSRFDEQLSWDRVNRVIGYVVENYNIDRNRFLFKYKGTAPANIIYYRNPYGYEEGPSSLPAPYPKLRTRSK